MGIYVGEERAFAINLIVKNFLY